MRGAALFNGIDSRIEVADHPRLRLGARDFSIAVWFYADAVTGDVVGDIISNFNPDIRRGFSLGVVTNSGMTTTTQSNYRNVHFGIDNGNIDSAWIDCGRPGNAVHIPALATINDHLYAGTFEPEADETGHLYRYDGEERWERVGKAGYEQEIMGMVLYNAKVYCGSLPMANAWRLDRDGLTFIANADNTPTAYLRRLWSLAVYRGRLFGGTLPSGHIMSLSAGAMATCDRALAPGWRHMVATRRADVLELHVDGNMVAESRAFQRADYDLTTNSPLSIGCGVGHAFRGAMRDLRIYNTALGEAEARQFAQAK